MNQLLLSANNSEEQLGQTLKEVFGYDNFRPLQQNIMTSVLKGQDSLVIMPTGGGKSLCYQVPALLFEGLTVVVSPLISLMTDQVRQLHDQGVVAKVLNSTLESEEYRQTMRDIGQGKLQIVYLAPETLLKPIILQLLASARVKCLAIDEAHCVSEWGHDFRIEYRQLASIRSKLNDPVYIALTATATERVQSDIVKNLKLKSAKKFVASFDRANLCIKVSPKADSFKQMITFLNQRKGQSGIIYCFSRKKTESIRDKLVKEGYSANVYHAGLTPEQREKNQDLFIKDKVQIMVATIAFGMGINKSNVRFVIHADLPKNLESYYQEIGRAGRDSLRADCLLLYSSGDSAKIRHFIEDKNEKEKRIALDQLETMISYSENHDCRRKALLRYFGETYSESNCQMCDNCLEPKSLEDITIPTQKLLSCIHRVEQRFGANYIVDMLRGSNIQRILDNGHEKLSTHGIGGDLSKAQWKALIRQVLTQGLIAQDPDNYNILTITGQGYQVLKGDLQVEGVLEKEVKKVISPTQDLSSEYEPELFEALRSKRRDLAEAAGVPPYIIFSDKSLLEMAMLKPENHEQFLLVNGVGKNKLEKYGDIFISVIKQ